ncbi:MAG: hypothetical protein M9888_02030 [Chitinophagales bacterium]|nr:hypothetical protein [Chitinophagales bacterium]
MEALQYEFELNVLNSYFVDELYFLEKRYEIKNSENFDIFKLFYKKDNDHGECIYSVNINDPFKYIHSIKKSHKISYYIDRELNIYIKNVQILKNICFVNQKFSVEDITEKLFYLNENQLFPFKKLSLSFLLLEKINESFELLYKADFKLGKLVNFNLLIEGIKDFDNINETDYSEYFQYLENRICVLNFNYTKPSFSVFHPDNYKSIKAFYEIYKDRDDESDRREEWFEEYESSNYSNDTFDALDDGNYGRYDDYGGDISDMLDNMGRG